MITTEALQVYRDWFSQPSTPSTVDVVKSLVSGLTQAEDRDHARLQVMTLAQVMHLSPSTQVQTIAMEMKERPDGIVSEAITRLHEKITNPLDLVVYLHSPACKNLLLEVAPKLFEPPETQAVAYDDEPTVLV